MAYKKKITFDQIDWNKGDVGRSYINVPGKGNVPVIYNRVNNNLYCCMDIPPEFLITHQFRALKDIAIRETPKKY